MNRGGALLGLGTFRFVLAFFVLSSHLWVRMPHGFAAYAVWGFFVLSGYLMTFVLREKYGFSRAGLGAYARNRFLRIAPTYWLALSIGVVTLVVCNRHGIDLTQLNPAFSMPRSFSEWLFPTTLLVVFPLEGLPVPVANALAIEVSAYLLMPLLASHRSAAWTALALSAYANFRLGFTIESFAERYATFLPCMWPFAIGSLLAHYRDRLRPLARPGLSCAAWMLHGLIWFQWDRWPWTYGLYTSALLSAWLVLSLVDRRSSRADVLIGDLSYPLYLFHTTIGAWLVPTFGFGRSLAFAGAALVGTLLLSLAVVRFFERPLKSWKVSGALG